MEPGLPAAVASTYKALDVEETIDIYFYRPLGYAVARACRPLGITPNTITILSIIIGIISGHLFYYRDIALNLLGVLFWIIADTFDSADGQLARMTNHKSKFGRILDGLGGNIIFLSMYLHLMARMALTYDVAMGWMFLVVLAGGISHSLQSALADYYRNAYLKFVVDPKKSELESSDEIRREYDATTFAQHPMKKIFLLVYLNYTMEQEVLSKNFQKLRKRVDERFGVNIPQWFSEEYRRINLPLMKYYAILTTNTRMIIMSFCVVFDIVPLYFIAEIAGINLVLVMVMNSQERSSERLLALIEERKGEMVEK